jgi:hypothetical protein
MDTHLASIFAAACSAALALSTHALALGVSASTATPIQGTLIQAAGGIEIISPLVLPTVTVSAINSNAGFAGVSPSSGAGSSVSASSNISPKGAFGGNATLTIHGQVGDTVSTAVPESFQVIRTGGTEALTVNTNSNSDYGVAGNGIALGGAVMNGNAMSVNIGGAVSLASAAGNIVPGPYEGLLVVVVQYN